MKEEVMKKITILTASQGKNSELGKKILEIAEKDFKCKFVDLVDLNLPLYSEAEEEKGIPQKAKELSDSLSNSEGLVFIAPEYNGSVPPCLNNAICWISRSGKTWREAFNGKTTLIATHSGGGGHHVLMAMRQQLSFLGANVLGRQLLTNYNKELNVDSLNECLAQMQ